MSGVDVIADIREMPGYAAECCDAIYCCHAAEHFGRWEYMDAFRRWWELLRPGCSLWLAVPDFEAIVEHYREHGDMRALIGLLYGGQNWPGNEHRMAWTFDTLSADLCSAGFRNVERYDWREGPNPNADDYSKAYLPHMDKGGRLMSLNVRAC